MKEPILQMRESVKSQGFRSQCSIRKSAGFIAGEFVFSLIVFSLLALLLTSELSRSFLTYRALQKKSVEVQAVEALRLELLSLVRDTDTFPFHISPTIGSDGKIISPTGELVALNSPFAPHEDSDSLTFIKLIQSSLLVNNYFSEETQTWRSCRSFSGTVEFTHPRWIIGFGISGLALFTGSITPHPQMEGCFLVRVTPFQTSLSPFHGTPPSPSQCTAFVAVSEIASLYVDRNSELRRLSYEQDHVIENQPVVTGMRPFTLELSDSPFSLTATPRGSTRPIHARSSMASINPALLALNLRRLARS